MRARVVFDLDGTLIDSAPDIRACANAVLEPRGHHPLSPEETRRFIGSGTPVFVERMRRARGIAQSEQAPMLDAFLAHYEHAVDLTRLYPGAREALAALRAAGHGLALCTNKPVAPTRAVLAHFGLDTILDPVFGGDSLPVRKPDPAPLLAALDALGHGPALYVGDSETDAETAERAAVPFLLFTQGYRKAPVEAMLHTAAFDHFDALPALVRDIAGETA